MKWFPLVPREVAPGPGVGVGVGDLGVHFINGGNAYAMCNALAGAKPAEVDCVAVARPLTAGPGLHVQLRAMFPNARLAVMEHHEAHAASAYYASGYDEATVLTLDRSERQQPSHHHQTHTDRDPRRDLFAKHQHREDDRQRQESCDPA